MKDHFVITYAKKSTSEDNYASRNLTFKEMRLFFKVFKLLASNVA